MPLENKLGSLSLDSDGDDGDVEDYLVIGIDFGTTYSGVGWATKADFENNQINFITSWPGTGREEGKVPTELCYDDDGEASWGYDVPPDKEPFRWFKLLLLNSEDLDPEVRESEFVTSARKLMEDNDYTAVGLVAEYLRLLWDHIMSTIERALGEIAVEALQFHVVITVPAIWKGYARQAMEDAAEASGILDYRLAGETSLAFAPEPEAAAMSTLLEQGSGIRPGNVYTICDAGGGTVDLISYEVESIKPLVLREAVPGLGGLCGGIFIDQTFERICSGRLGSRWKRLSKTGIREVMKNEWEYGIKPQFKLGKAKKEYIVALPAELFNQSTSSLDDRTREPYIKNGRLHLLDHHIKTAFEVVVSEIEHLVQRQIRMAAEKNLAVTGIILVGGLGSSPYLYEYLKAVNSNAGISVLQSGGIKPRTAICRGAVIKGFLNMELDQSANDLPITIASTVSRASYGIVCRQLFDKSRHLAADKFWCEIEGRWRAVNQMEWYLKRGDTVSKMQPVRHSWFKAYTEKDEFDGNISLTFYQCDDENPPTRKVKETEDAIRPLGTLCCDLGVSLSDLPSHTGTHGKRYRKLSYEVELVPSGASVEFVLYFQGERKGSEKVKIRGVKMRFS